MKIAHILSSFDIGGQERVAVDLARAQRAAGHVVVAVSLSAGADGPNREILRSHGVRTMSARKWGGVDPSLPLRLATRLMLERVDLVHTHNPHALVYGATAGALVGAGVVHTKHGINPGRARQVLLRRAAGTLVDTFVVVTPLLAKVALQNRECDPARLHVVPNGIDVAAFAPSSDARSLARAGLGIPEDAWVVGTVGRLAPEKDQALLVRAMLPLLKGGTHLVIVGDGPEREALAALIGKSECAPFVHMLGARNDVSSLLPGFDVFALSSRTEGLPLVLLEAMSMQLCVVSTAVGGIPDLIEHGVTGFLVKPGDLAALSAQLTSLSEDPRRTARIGPTARRTVVRLHSLERMAARYEALYARLVAGPRLAVDLPGHLLRTAQEAVEPHDRRAVQHDERPRERSAAPDDGRSVAE
jgi:glycosyltransferase involved in cell wall biosynthesis